MLTNINNISFNYTFDGFAQTALPNFGAALRHVQWLAWPRR
jgi:hypothetical protein